MTTRRDFLVGAAAGLTAALAPPLTATASAKKAAAARPAPKDWAGVRAQFRLRKDRIHLAGMLFASHPRPVRDAIEALRDRFDADPVGAIEGTLERGMDDDVRRAIVAYTGGTIEDVMLTDSTTMGLGLVYGGLRLAPGDEILTSIHDHYSTFTALRSAAARTGAKVRAIPLYADGLTADATQIVAALAGAITATTRVVALTWVHSSSGVKLPIRKLADAIATVNARRDARTQVLFVVDGVHGFGVEADRVADLGCDVFITGCHKWLLGPRGTGFVWARPTAWPRITPIIPSFEQAPFEAFVAGHEPPTNVSAARLGTPGGFHSFDHRYALPAAFTFHTQLGPARIAARLHELASQVKAGLAQMKHVTLHTPAAPELSAGIVCYSVAGLTPDEVVKRLAARKIVSTNSPYPVSYARLTPALWNTPGELDTALAAVRALAAS